MRDERQPFLPRDIGIAAPLLLSLFMLASAALQAMSPTALAAVLGLHFIAMAAAAASPAARAAALLQVMTVRMAPQAAAARHALRQWRSRLGLLAGLGLLGPVALALRLVVAGQVPSAVWVLCLPCCGLALGSFGGWAWLGHARKRWLNAWSSLPLIFLALYVGRDVWTQQAWLAAVCLGMTIVAVWGAARHATRLHPEWPGLRSVANPVHVAALQAGSGRDTWLAKASRNRKGRWEGLAYASGPSKASINVQSSPSLLVGAMPVAIFLMGCGPLLGAHAMDLRLQGWALAGYAAWMLFLSGTTAAGLVTRMRHWRFRLAPSAADSPSKRARCMLAGSMAFWTVSACVGLLLAWLANHRDPAILRATVPVLADVWAAVAYGAWLRGRRNAGTTVAAGALALALGVLIVGLASEALGWPLVGSAEWMLVEAVAAAGWTLAAYRRWQGQALRGDSEFGRQDPA